MFISIDKFPQFKGKNKKYTTEFLKYVINKEPKLTRIVWFAVLSILGFLLLLSILMEVLPVPAFVNTNKAMIGAALAGVGFYIFILTFINKHLYPAVKKYKFAFDLKKQYLPISSSPRSKLKAGSSVYGLQCANLKARGKKQENILEEKILNQLTWIKWSILAIAFFVVTPIASLAWVEMLRQTGMDYSHATKHFQDKAQQLLTSGAEREVIPLAIARGKDYPKDPNVHFYLGRAYFQLKDYQKAIPEFTAAEGLSPDWRGVIQPFLFVAKKNLNSVANTAGPTTPVQGASHSR